MDPYVTSVNRSYFEHLVPFSSQFRSPLPILIHPQLCCRDPSNWTRCVASIYLSGEPHFSRCCAHIVRRTTFRIEVRGRNNMLVIILSLIREKFKRVLFGLHMQEWWTQCGSNAAESLHTYRLRSGHEGALCVSIGIDIVHYWFQQLAAIQLDWHSITAVSWDVLDNSHLN